MTVYRVVTDHGDASKPPVHTYMGEDIDAALKAFVDAFPTDIVITLRGGMHIFRNEPLVECRNAVTGKMIAALIGVSFKELQDRSKEGGT